MADCFVIGACKAAAAAAASEAFQLARASASTFGDGLSLFVDLITVGFAIDDFGRLVELEEREREREGAGAGGEAGTGASEAASATASPGKGEPGCGCFLFLFFDGNVEGLGDAMGGGGAGEWTRDDAGESGVWRGRAGKRRSLRSADLGGI